MLAICWVVLILIEDCIYIHDKDYLIRDLYQIKELMLCIAQSSILEIIMEELYLREIVGHFEVVVDLF